MTATPNPLLSLQTVSSASTYRLQSLYSDFTRQKRSNPTSYNANVEWWRITLEEVVWRGLQVPNQNSRANHLVLNAGQTLVDSLKIEGAGKPIGLGAVITELSQPHISSSSKLPSLFPLSAFLSAPTSLYNTTSGSLPVLLATYLVAKPLWWSLEKLGITGEDGILPTPSRSNAWHGDYVVLNLVERAAENVLLHRRLHGTAAPGDSLFSFETFRKTFSTCAGIQSPEADSEQSMSVSDANVLLKYLERDKGMVVVDKGVIKFIDKNVSAESKVTPVDVGILELKAAVENLHVQVEGIQRKIDQSTEKATAALKQKRKSLAMTYLRSRKQSEELLTKRLGSLDILESTLIRVEASAGDIKILETFQSSTATLRTILSHPSLQRESVEQTMEALAEANTDAKDIEDTIRIGGDVAIGIDEGAIEDELADLAREWEKEEAEKRGHGELEASEEEVRKKIETLGSLPTESLLLKARRVDEDRVPATAS